jgi:Aminopeptidase P, N-terminal domain
MGKLLLCFLSVLIICGAGLSLDRQPGTDYRARREALAKKAGAVVVLLAPLEKMDAVYEFRQEDNFYYLSGVTVPGRAF